MYIFLSVFKYQSSPFPSFGEDVSKASGFQCAYNLAVHVLRWSTI